jgi:NADH-quinone oxidoreductase subunit N
MFETPNFAPLATEIFMLIMACVVLVADLFVKDQERRLTYWLSQFTMLGALYLTLNMFGAEKLVTFGGHYVLDDMALILKVGIFIIGFLVLLYSRPYINAREILRGEYYMLAIFAMLGASILVSAHSLLTIYLGLELMSLSSYAMVACYRDSRLASEAAIKYFVMGAMASGFILYGMSLIYGTTGSIDISVIASAINATAESGRLMFAFGLVFIVCGLAFKIGAVPFHMWMPDVYHGAPTSVTAFIGSVPKLASFAMIMRILVEALPDLANHWMLMLIILSFLSMGIGNITAVVQTNIKRLLAYSAIAHMGYFLLGLIAGTPEGYSASMFYILVYALTTMAGFGMIIFMSRAGFECDTLDDFKGLWQRSPWYALMMLMTLMSMAGVPPFIGFWPKLEVILAVINADKGLMWLAISAMVFSVVGAFIYLKVAKAIFFDNPDSNEPIEAAMDMKLALSANGIAMIALGLFPSIILAYCVQAFS